MPLDEVQHVLVQPRRNLFLGGEGFELPEVIVRRTIEIVQKTTDGFLAPIEGQSRIMIGAGVTGSLFSHSTLHHIRCDGGTPKISSAIRISLRTRQSWSTIS